MARANSKAAASALIGIYRLLLFVLIIGCLYYGQSLLIPFTLAALLTFLLSPLANKLEKYVGRIISVITIILMFFLFLGIIGYMITQQVSEFGAKLPVYKANIENRLSSFEIPKDSAFTQTFSFIEKMESHLTQQYKEPPVKTAGKILLQPTPIKMVETPQSDLAVMVKTFVASLVDVMGSMGLIILLLIFMLSTREDMRGRLIRLIGPTRISATTRALDDASQRVTHYLGMQLLINVIYGVIVALGLFVLGVPNAILWGGLAIILRFIPYLGAWIAALLPFIVALAISTSWTIPVLTLTLFIILDIVIGNIIEPLLYSSKTGISSLALIVSAVFWTLLWGPIGLLFSTPLTVCMVVMGRHIPKLEFLHVLLSDEESLALYEEFYQRLIALEFTEALELIHNYLTKNSLINLYDSTLIPTLSAAEIDRRNELLEEDQIILFHQNIQLILDDIFTQATTGTDADNVQAIIDFKNYHILCLPSATERDEIASLMLMQVLTHMAFTADNATRGLATKEIFDLVEKGNYDAICISVVKPYLIIPARKLSFQLHKKFPQIKLLIGLWGAPEINADIEEELKKAGVDAIIFSLTDATTQLEKFSIAKAHSTVEHKE